MSQRSGSLRHAAFADHCSAVLLVSILVALYLGTVNPNSDWQTAVSSWAASATKVSQAWPPLPVRKELLTL